MGAFRVLAAGCGGYREKGAVECRAEPTVVGLRLIRAGGDHRAAWRGFACDEHAEQLIAARPLLPRDRDVLARRRRMQLVSGRAAGEPEGPLARGREADLLIERALAWAATRG